ncbi:Hypothetical Protein FCC1311_066082 [Hondaea fermentalgiana]|uniref:Uncharacterized protein n=1 Tax=Hondaea fermentalgiana TaxID=2315210 RepID=A0A2R5GJ94_9STRA|nr:Hypothetical Protein FCC1311_066082 [Hondaea fermentalgiana]|eukprot:GBG30389.1 Hypothetical Protein FCC1311_066082 [Hondaea fermentalgiana]
MLGLDTTPTFLIFNHIACESALAILFLVRFAEYYDRMKRSRLHRIAPRRKPCINRSILTRATPLPFIICNILAFSSLQDIYVLKVVAMSLLCLLGALGILALYILIMPILLDLNEIVGTAKPASHTVQFDRVYMLHNRTRWLLLSGLALCLVVILVSLLPLLLPSLRAYMSIFVAITIILGKLPRVILAQKDSVFRLKPAKSAHLRLDLQYIKHQRINKNLDFSEMARENIRAVEDYVRVLRSGDFGNSDERHSTTADLLSSNLLFSNHE